MPSIGSIKAGHAYVVIGALDDTGKMLAKIGSNIQKWGSSLTNLGLDLGFKSFLALTPAAMGLNTFMKFDDLMKQVQARTGATTAQMQDLGQVARTVGRDIGLTATQIAEIFAELSTKDFGIGEMKSMVRPIALLAKATGSGSDKDMKLAGSLMSQTIQAFHLGADQAAKVADVLTVVANKSNFALDDLAEAMSHVSSTASMMGMSFEQTIAIMAQMRNVGIQAESASIGLRNIILNSANQKETQKFNDALKSMGLAAVDFSDKAGNLENPTKLLFTIMDRIKGLGSQVRMSLLENLFGKRAINPAAAAGAAKDTFDELMKSIQAATGEAEKISLVMETGIGGTWRRITTSVHELAIKFGTVLEPALKLAADRFTKLINAAAEWISVHPKIVIAATTATASLFGLAAALMATGTAAKLLGLAVSGLSLVFFAFDGARKVVVLGLAMLRNAIVVTTVVVGLVVTAAKVMMAIVLGIGTAVTFIASALTMVFSFLEGLGAMIVLAGAGPLFLNLAGAIAVVALSAFALLKIFEGGRGVAFDFANSFIAGLGRIRQFFGFFANYLKDSFIGLWNTIVSSGLEAFAQLSEGIALAFQLSQIGDFENAWKVAIKTISTAFMNFWDEVSVKADEVFTDVLTSFFHVVTEMSNALSRMIAKMGFANPMAPPLQKLNEGMGEGLNAMARSIAARRKGEWKADQDMQQRKIQRDDDLNNFIAGIKEDMPNAAEPLAEKIRALFQQFQGGAIPGEMDGSKTLKPIEGLEKGSMEAAKAAWEGAGEAGQKQVDLLAGILNGLIALNQKLQVA